MCVINSWLALIIRTFFIAGSFVRSLVLSSTTKARSETIQATTSRTCIFTDSSFLVLLDLQTRLHRGFLVWGDITYMFHLAACIPEIAKRKE